MRTGRRGLEFPGRRYGYSAATWFLVGGRVDNNRVLISTNARWLEQAAALACEPRIVMSMSRCQFDDR